MYQKSKRIFFIPWHTEQEHLGCGTFSNANNFVRVFGPYVKKEMLSNSERTSIALFKIGTRYISQIPPPKSNTLPLNIYHPLNKRKGIIFQASFFQGFWQLNFKGGVVFLRLTQPPPPPRIREV